MIWRIKNDAKRFIAEDIVVYSVLLAFTLFWDFVYAEYYRFIGSVDVHPFHFGAFQLLGACFFALQILRGLNRWRYHG